MFYLWDVNSALSAVNTRSCDPVLKKNMEIHKLSWHIFIARPALVKHGQCLFNHIVICGILLWQNHPHSKLPHIICNIESFYIQGCSSIIICSGPHCSSWGKTSSLNKLQLLTTIIRSEVEILVSFTQCSILICNSMADEAVQAWTKCKFSLIR